MATRGRGLFSLYIYTEKFKNLLVRNHWTDFNITRQECFFCNFLPRLFKPSWYVKNHSRQRGGTFFFFNSPDLCSGWAIVITFPPSINIFKWLLLWSRWANFAQISCGASLGWGNERLLKWSWSVDPRWPPCTYMVKTFKNLLTEDALGLNLCKNHQGQEVYQSCYKICRKLAFDLFTARSSLLPYAFVWEKPLKIFFSKTEHALWLNLCTYHREWEGYQSC